MSEDTQVRGEIRIDPPIPATDLTNSLIPVGPWLPGDRWDVALLIADAGEPEVRDGVVVIRRHAVAIVPERVYQSAYHLQENIQEVIDQWGAGRTFIGWLDCSYAHGEEVWRVGVVAGRVVRQTPTMLWPHDEDAVVRVASELCARFCQSCYEDDEALRTHRHEAEAVIAALTGGAR
jgi:hypothetical protein